MSGKSHFVNQIILNWTVIYPGDKIRKIIIVHKFPNQSAYRELINKYGDLVQMTNTFDEQLLENSNMDVNTNGTIILLLDDTLHLIAKNSLLCQLIIGSVHHER